MFYWDTPVLFLILSMAMAPLPILVPFDSTFSVSLLTWLISMDLGIAFGVGIRKFSLIFITVCATLFNKPCSKSILQAVQNVSLLYQRPDAFAGCHPAMESVGKGVMQENELQSTMTLLNFYISEGRRLRSSICDSGDKWLNLSIQGSSKCREVTYFFQENAKCFQNSLP